MGLLHTIWMKLLNFTFITLLIIWLPGLPPRTTFPFAEFEIPPPRELKGALDLNNHLDGAEHFFSNQVYGPECLLERNNEIYMGIHGGEVIKVKGQHVVHIAKFGQPCESILQESVCGRPLGLAFDTIGNNLIVADAYFGIWQVSLESGQKKLWISPQQELPGIKINRKAKTFNAVAVDRKGKIYWTDSSSDFLLEDLVFTSLANPSGRLFVYDRTQNKTEVLLDELFFPNGVALSPEEDFIIVAESGALRIMKYYLKGPKAGTSQVFVDGLPGLPDNLTPDSKGIWVPLVSAADSKHPSGCTIFSRFPNIRLYLVRMMSLFEMPFRFLHNIYPNKVTEYLVHIIGHLESLRLLTPRRATIIRLDWDGNIVGSLHGFDRSVGVVSHVLEIDNHLFLGSPLNHFLAKVKSPIKSQPVVKDNVQNTEKKKLPAKQKATPTTATLPTKPSTVKSTMKPTQTSSSTTAKPAAKPKQPAPVTEDIKPDTVRPKKEKLKVINKHGEHVEL